MTAVTICSDLGVQENKICHSFHFSPSICHEVMGPDAMILVFWMLSFNLAFSLSSTFRRGSLVPLCFLPSGWYHLHIWGCWYFSWQSWFQLVIHPAWYFAWCTLLLFLFSHSFISVCNPMDHSTPGFPVLHYLPEFAQTHVCWVDDAIQLNYLII